jgi:hypothetical protein
MSQNTKVNKNVLFRVKLKNLLILGVEIEMILISYGSSK